MTITALGRAKTAIFAKGGEFLILPGRCGVCGCGKAEPALRPQGRYGFHG